MTAIFQISTLSPASARLSRFARGGAIAAAIALAGLLGGCEGVIPGSGPMKGAIESGGGEVNADYKLIEIDADNIGDYRPVPAMAGGSSALGARTQASVRLSPGDTMSVVISENFANGIFAPLSSGGTAFKNVMVSSAGTITLPYAGTVKVSGLSPTQVEHAIQSRLMGKSVEPQVYVELLANRNNSVLVSGDVKAPARVSLLEGPMTLIDAVNRAGGLNGPAITVDALVRGRSGTRRVAMSSVYAGANVELRAGDVVTILPSNRKFNAMGAVKTPGQQPMQSSDENLLDALNQVGGLNDNQANPTGVFLFRGGGERIWRDADGKWRGGWAVFRFDMRKPQMIFLAQNFGIKPGDTIYVTNAPATEWMKLIQPLAATLVTVRSGLTVPTTANGL